jgi:hypothetical protein
VFVSFALGREATAAPSTGGCHSCARPRLRARAAMQARALSLFKRM